MLDSQTLIGGRTYDFTCLGRITLRGDQSGFGKESWTFYSLGFLVHNGCGDAPTTNETLLPAA
jgi:hypothetical protein